MFSSISVWFFNGYVSMVFLSLSEVGQCILPLSPSFLTFPLPLMIVLGVCTFCFVVDCSSYYSVGFLAYVACPPIFGTWAALPGPCAPSPATVWLPIACWFLSGSRDPRETAAAYAGRSTAEKKSMAISL